MDITIVTLATPEIHSYATLTFSNNYRYAKAHHYIFSPYMRTLDDRRPPSWSKVLALLDQMDFSDWLFWIDADAMFVNFDKKIESLIDDNFDFIVASDDNGLNCGVMLMKCNDYMKTILCKVYAKDEFVNHQWWEQAGFHDLFYNDEEFFKRTKIVPKNKMNSYPADYKSGDFILHFANMTAENRVSAITDFINNKGLI